MAGKNRVRRLPNPEQLVSFSVQLDKQTLSELRDQADQGGCSVGHLIRKMAADAVENKTFITGMKTILVAVRESPLIKGDPLPDGKKYSDYVSDHLAAQFGIKQWEDQD